MGGGQRSIQHDAAVQLGGVGEGKGQRDGPHCAGVAGQRLEQQASLLALVRLPLTLALRRRTPSWEWGKSAGVVSDDEESESRVVWRCKIQGSCPQAYFMFPAKITMLC